MMVRRRLSRALVALVAAALAASGAACGSGSPPRLTPSPSALAVSRPLPSPTPSPAPTTSVAATATALPTRSPTPTRDTSEDPIARMGIEEKIGQMLMVGLPGPALDEAARHLVADLHVGGVVLLLQNAESPAQVQALVGELQALAARQRVPVPLFVAINHEGGSVVRVRTGVTVFPSNMAVGATGSPALAYEIGRLGAEELSAMGINMNLAPVLDVNSEPANPVIGLRSFGARPAQVAEYGAQFIRGTQAAGVIAVAKHFPGHGGVAVDSHQALPTLTAPADVIWSRDLAPFRRAIAEGVDAVMSAHLVVPALGAETEPATLSRAVMTDLLRGRLGFRGVTITDDLGMKGITGQMTQAEAAVRAVEAGNDVVVVVYSTEAQDATYRALAQAVRDGRLSERRIDESVRRILALKARYGLAQAQRGPLAAVGTPAHEALARRASAAAITVANGRGLPLAAGQRALVISPRSLAAGEVGGTLLGQEVHRRAAASQEFVYDPYNLADLQRVLADAPALALECDQVVIGLWNAALGKAERHDDAPYRLVQALAATGRPVAVVALQLPYDLAGLPEGVAAVATYGETPSQVAAAVAVLYGEAPAPGTLPVPLREND